MKILYDKERTFKPEIHKHLRAYNKSFSGPKISMEKYFYLKEDNKLKAQVCASLAWDWVSLGDLRYENTKYLKELLSYVSNNFNEMFLGFQIRESDQSTIDDLIKAGFSYIGTLESTPKTKEYHYVEYQGKLPIIKTDYEFIISEEEIKEYEVEEEIYTGTSYQYNAFEEDEFIGGIHFDIEEDALHLGLLVVTNEFKGKGVGIKLMEKMFEIAKEHNVIKCYVGTAEFQARGFYEKFGFEVRITRQDYPLGFENYKLVKKM